MISFRGMTMSAVAAGALVLAGAVPTASAHENSATIEMQDQCDPATFNAVFPGICATAGQEGVTFTDFIAALTADPAGVLEDRDAEGWQFDPSETGIKAGEDLVAVNTGGEGHTFTEVPHFGAGCVPDLNKIFGFKDPNPKCATDFPATVIAPGTSIRVSGLRAGKTYRFECLIHPWMRTTIRVE